MRRIIFILMIALLPLRGWMGEAMATEMATMNLVAVQAVNTLPTAYSSSNTSMSDCDMHKDMMYDNTNKHQTCSDCQACHFTGMLQTVQIISSLPLQHALPIANLAGQTSAERYLAQKPPIL